MSGIRQHLSTVYRHNGEWILGDSGYPLEPWLITPIDHPTNQDEITFNNLQAKARNTVERAIGLLKARWRCTCKQRMLHYSPTVARKIINACAALHNFCLAHFDHFDEPFNDEVGDDDDNILFGVNQSLADVGDHNRQEIMDFIRQFV